MDSNKGFFDWRGHGPNEEPPYGLFYVTIVPFMAAVGFVAWLGWSWLALIATAGVTLVVGGFAVHRWVRKRRTEREPIPEWR